MTSSPAPAPIAPTPIAFAQRRDKPTVLVVDDVIEVLDTLEEQLSSHLGRNFVVEKAASGEEALEVIADLQQRGRELAVVVADVIMPGLKGDELLIAVKQRCPDAITIMLTGEQGDPARITNAINRAGLYRFIAKPWEMRDMQLTVEEAAKSFVSRSIIEQQARLLTAIHEASQVVARQRDLESIARALIAVLTDYAGAERATLVLASAAPGASPVVVAQGQAGQPVRGLQVPLAQAQGLPTAAIGQLLAPGAATEAPVGAPGAHVLLPLVTSGRTLGVLVLELAAGAALPPERLEALRLLAAQAAIAIDNAYTNENLETLVGSRTQELLAVSSHKDEMVRIVSHDIRSPLSGIAALAELLAQGELGDQPTEVRRYGEMISTSTHSVLKLVSDVLDLAKLQSGTILLSRQLVDLSLLCHRVLDSYAPVFLAKQLQLVPVIQEGIVGELDEPKLTQVLGNLLSNAAKFSEPGGRVSFTLDRTVEGERLWARLRVVDTGLGIAPEALPRVFERFGVKQRTGTAGEKGSGLGLSIAHELVQLHGGHIGIESTVNVGTTFTILLPL